MHRLVVVVCFLAGLLASQSPAIVTALNSAPTSRVELRSVPPLRLTGDVDSNSPAIWDHVGGRSLLFVMTSMSGQPSTAVGSSMDRLGSAQRAAMDPWPGGGVWMEAIVKDVDGTWYGYYHQEVVASMCGIQKALPRIGAARSRDAGQTWETLGTILSAPPGSYDCTTNNQYFVGGVGDLSVQLDPLSQDLFIFYSLYLRSQQRQGVSVARLAWADRDEPVGKIMVWRGGSWTPAYPLRTAGMQTSWIYPAAEPLFPTALSWHDDDRVVDAFWGPSVHWNTHLEQYVMLLNRAKDETFAQEGIYVSFSPQLGDPTRWSTPVKMLAGGKWYPQVIGLEAGTGTDKVAGEWARFFMMGTSNHLIRFIR